MWLKPESRLGVFIEILSNQPIRRQFLRVDRNSILGRTKVAPWPGFEPGSSGRQPLILDRAILPGPKPYPCASKAPSEK
jgi:hypothetical protein